MTTYLEAVERAADDLPRLIADRARLEWLFANLSDSWPVPASRWEADPRAAIDEAMRAHTQTEAAP